MNIPEKGSSLFASFDSATVIFGRGFTLLLQEDREPGVIVEKKIWQSAKF